MALEIERADIVQRVGVYIQRGELIVLYWKALEVTADPVQVSVVGLDCVIAAVGAVAQVGALAQLEVKKGMLVPANVVLCAAKVYTFGWCQDRPAVLGDSCDQHSSVAVTIKCRWQRV
jgi:hypothetical protein